MSINCLFHTNLVKMDSHRQPLTSANTKHSTSTPNICHSFCHRNMISISSHQNDTSLTRRNNQLTMMIAPPSTLLTNTLSAGTTLCLRQDWQSWPNPSYFPPKSPAWFAQYQMATAPCRTANNRHAYRHAPAPHDPSDTYWTRMTNIYNRGQTATLQPQHHSCRFQAWRQTCQINGGPPMLTLQLFHLVQGAACSEPTDLPFVHCVHQRYLLRSSITMLNLAHDGLHEKTSAWGGAKTKQWIPPPVCRQ